MTHTDLDPDLERLGDALRAATTVDLAREARVAAETPAHRAGWMTLRRPRVLAGGTLGLAGVGTALALTLTAGGAAAPAAFAITTNSNGSLTINLDTDGGLLGANRKLAAMGHDEHIWFQMAPGAAASTGAITCTPQSGVTGPAIQLTVGPGVTNSETIAAGNTGAGTWHVAQCGVYDGTDTTPIPTGTLTAVPEATATVPANGRRHVVKVAHRSLATQAK